MLTKQWHMDKGGNRAAGRGGLWRRGQTAGKDKGGSRAVGRGGVQRRGQKADKGKGGYRAAACRRAAALAADMDPTALIINPSFATAC